MNVVTSIYKSRIREQILNIIQSHHKILTLNNECFSMTGEKLVNNPDVLIKHLNIYELKFKNMKL